MVRYKVLQPSLIRFTTDTIPCHFDNGLHVNGCIESIAQGSIKPGNIEPIRVFNLKGTYYTCDNRRLYVFRVAQRLELLDYISVAVVSPCEYLSMIKPGQDGLAITFVDGSEPHVHWLNSWGFPKVIDRQISNSSTVSHEQRKSISEKVMSDSFVFTRFHQDVQVL